MSDWTIVLSGPEASRPLAQDALEAAGLALLPSDHHALMNWASKYPDDPDTFVTVVGRDVNTAVDAVDGVKGWRLRVHYPTPEKPTPSPEQVLTATVAEMRAEIDALKAKVG